MRNIRRKNEKALITEFIQILKSEINKKNKRNERLSFVLTGGSSPIKLYKKLSQSKIDWSNVDFFWGDERYVHKKSKNSNYKLAQDLLFKKAKIKNKNLFSIQTNVNEIKKSSDIYENTIRRYFKGKKIKFDIFLLGMGKDGHIASIFPNSKLLNKKFISSPVNREDFKRITLSLNIINNSKKIILWLNNRLKTNKFLKFKNKKKSIPVNYLNKKKLLCFSIK